MKIATHKKIVAGALLVGAGAGLGHTGCGEQVAAVADIAPAVPTGVYTVTGDGWVDVLWNPVRESDMEGYGIYRGNTSDGAYRRIGTNRGVENTSFHDDDDGNDLANGTTYYYAVDSFDFAGNESDLSYEESRDTPRPARTGLTVFAKEIDATQSGIDFSSYATPMNFVRPFDHVDTDIVFQRLNGVLYAKGTIRQTTQGAVPNDVQDLGYTSSFDEITWAPGQGWSVSPDGVELILGHTYVVWTWEEYFAKFRVTAVNVDAGQNPTGVTIDWGYQIDQNNPELSPNFARGEEQAREREDS